MTKKTYKLTKPKKNKFRKKLKKTKIATKLNFDCEEKNWKCVKTPKSYCDATSHPKT